MTETTKTIDDITGSYLCTGCGTCVSMCPRSAIEMVKEEHKGIYVPQLDREICDNCGICFDVCPGYSIEFRQLNSAIFGKEPEDILMGNHTKCYVGYATDYEVRYNSASGGMVTALLLSALEEGRIVGALVTKMSEENPLEPEVFIARTGGEIISAAKSKYCPVPANTALKDILKEKGKFAAVGLPCHIHGIRKAELINKELKEKLVFTVGIFCNHAPSFLATEYILRKTKVEKRHVKRLDYRGQGWPGVMRIGLGNSEVSIPLQKYWPSGFGVFFCPMRCTLCSDALCELADISFGDAWMPELTDDTMGTSVVISRSEVGESILQNAVQREKIKLHEVSKEAVLKSQWGVLKFKKKSLKARISLMKLVGKKVPIYDTEMSKTSLGDYLRAISCYLRIYLGRRRCLWGLLFLYSSYPSGKSVAGKLLRFTRKNIRL